MPPQSCLNAQNFSANPAFAPILTSPAPASAEMVQLLQLAEKLDYVMQPLESFRKEFVNAAMNRLNLREHCCVLSVCSLSFEQLPSSCGGAAVPPLPNELRHREGNDLDSGFDKQSRKLHGQSACSAAPFRCRRVASASEAVRAIHSCACNADAADGGVVGADGQGAGQVVCELVLCALRRSRRASSSIKDDARRELALSAAQGKCVARS
eukprot:6191455-Pleurochrysis_carterae.AAC.1